jgi:hypothetical protein
MNATVEFLLNIGFAVGGFLVGLGIAAKKKGVQLLKLEDFTEEKNLNPIEIIVMNISNETTEVELFNFHQNAGAPNYGQPSHIKIETSYADYRRVLFDSAFSPFKVGRLRLASANSWQFNNTIFYREVHPDGREMSFPFPLHHKSEDDDFNNKALIEIDFDKWLDSKCAIKFRLEANTTLRLTLFIDKRLDLCKALSLTNYNLPDKESVPAPENIL